MTETDLDAVRYTNGMTRNTVNTWLREAERRRDNGEWINLDTRHLIDVCMSWLDIEQQLVETKKEIAFEESCWRADRGTNEQ